jgi:thymidylate synthase (FAD)
MYKKYEEIVEAKLISYSQPSIYINHLKGSRCDDDSLTNLISYCARVSNPKNQDNLETTNKLVQYLINHKHWSPFEMVNVCLEIVTTRDIARQILRHRSFSFQEYSQRYADPTKDLEFCLRECRLQDNRNRQNSIEFYDEEVINSWNDIQTELINISKSSYEHAISKGIAKEVARVLLPEGNTVSRLYINGSIRSWIHYLEVRLSNGTQKEHVMVASKCAVKIAEIFPIINN